MPRIHGAQAQSWWGSTVPANGPIGTTTNFIGNRIRFAVPGRVAGFRFYDGFNSAGTTSTHFELWTWTATRKIQRVMFFDWKGASVGAQWNQQWFRPWFRPVVGTDYFIAVVFPSGGWFRTNSALTSPVTHNGITFVSSSQSTALDLSIATLAEGTPANAVDVLFYPD